MKGLIFPLFVLSWLVGFVWMLLYIRQLKKRYPKLHADIFRDPFQKKIRNDWRLFFFWPPPSIAAPLILALAGSLTFSDATSSRSSL